MFNWIKNLFCRPEEQSFNVVHIVYELKTEEPIGYDVIKPKRKYTKRKKNKTRKGKK